MFPYPSPYPSQLTRRAGTRDVPSVVLPQVDHDLTVLVEQGFDGPPLDRRPKSVPIGLRPADEQRPRFVDWDGEGDVGAGPGRNRGWLHRAARQARFRLDHEFDKVPGRVADFHLECDRSGRQRRRFDQRASSGQDGQHEAEGDGPQHRTNLLAAVNRISSRNSLRLLWNPVLPCR